MMPKKRALAIALALTASSVFADTSSFDVFTPRVGDTVAGSLPESAPFVLASPKFSQVNIATRDITQARRFDSGTWDMLTVNENGPEAGRYLFSVHETSQPGIQRTDLRTMQTTTIWSSPSVAPALDSTRSFDASRWTPWGSFLTAEESWSDSPASPSIHGRLFEVINPLAAPADIVIKHRAILPRVSHEGLAFDKQNNLYFIDERNDSHLFKFTSMRPNATQGDEFFAKGQTFVLRVGDGKDKEATGKASWIPLTDVSGHALPGAVVVTDPNGLIAIDGRATPKLPAFLGTRFDRPEDLEIKTLKTGTQQLYMATTTHHKVFSIDLSHNRVKLFVSRDTLDMASGKPVGAPFTNPDNLAIDADGNLYIVEDQEGGKQDTWFAKDGDNDGVAEAIGKWASLTTVGAEASGLYFDPFNPDLAYINVQHPDSKIDRTFMFTTPGRKSGKGNGPDRHRKTGF